MIVAGSTWNAKLLQAHGLLNVRTVLQGVDPTLFHPARRQGLFPDRFLVFSGGKLERRKGQDIVLAGFRQFASRHPEALLVTAWHSPFPSEARSLDVGRVVSPVVSGEGGRLDPAAWAVANGIRAEQVLDLGAAPNATMPAILREMDAAVFPNRGEGGTNLVAMEAMACGVPTVLSRNTGHLDLIEDGNCYTLDDQGVLSGLEGPFCGVPGWGESDPAELAEALERIYRVRKGAELVGARGAETLRRLSWASAATQLKDILLEFG